MRIRWVRRWWHWGWGLWMCLALLLPSLGEAVQFGAGTGSSYPSALDTSRTFTNKSGGACSVSDTTKVCAEIVNDLESAIVAIQTFLKASSAATLDATALTWSALQTFSAGLTVSAGQITVPLGTQTAPSIVAAGGTNTGIFFRNASRVSISINGGETVEISGNILNLPSSAIIGWSATIDPGGASDTTLSRDAPNTLAIRNGPNVQAFNLYKTFTDVNNYERLSLWADATNNVFRIDPQALGTGVVRNLVLGGAGGVNVGIANLSPGALLDLGLAGTTAGVVRLAGATSGNLSLKVPAVAGVNSAITFPAGITDFSGTGGASQVVKQTGVGAAFTVAQLNYTDLTGLGAVSYIPMGAVSIQTSATGVGNAADATDDTLFTYTLPANALSANGKSLRVRAWGKTAANANNKTIKLWFAGANTVTSGAIPINALDWATEMELTRIDSTHLSVVATYENGALANGVTTVTANLVVADLGLNTSILKVTGASAALAANDVLGMGMKVWFEN